jgi:hypothetical protein
LLDLRHRVGEAIVSGGLVGGELKICLIAMRNFSARHYFLDIRAKEVVAMTSFPLPGSPPGQMHFFHVTGSTHSGFKPNQLHSVLRAIQASALGRSSFSADED